MLVCTYSCLLMSIHAYPHVHGRLRSSIWNLQFPNIRTLRLFHTTCRNSHTVDVVNFSSGPHLFHRGAMVTLQQLRVHIMLQISNLSFPLSFSPCPTRFREVCTKVNYITFIFVVKFHRVWLWLLPLFCWHPLSYYNDDITIVYLHHHLHHPLRMV